MDAYDKTNNEINMSKFHSPWLYKVVSVIGLLFADAVKQK